MARGGRIRQGRKNKLPGCLSATNVRAVDPSRSASQEAMRMTSGLTQPHPRSCPETPSPSRKYTYLQGWEAGPPPAPVNSGGALPSSGAPGFCSVCLAKLRPVSPTERVDIAENPKRVSTNPRTHVQFMPGHILLAEHSCDTEHRQC